MKKTLFKVEADKNLPAPGSAITLNSKKIGEIRSSANSHGLALLEIEATKKIDSAPLLTGDIEIKIV